MEFRGAFRTDSSFPAVSTLVLLLACATPTVPTATVPARFRPRASVENTPGNETRGGSTDQARTADEAVDSGPRERSDFADGAWWRAFGDAELDALVQRAVGASARLRAARARSAAALHVGRVTESNRWPVLGASASIARARTLNTAVGSVEATPIALSINAGYDVDLYNRVGADADAAFADQRAGGADAETAAQDLVVRVVEAWLDRRGCAAESAQIESLIRANEDLSTFIESRFRSGVATLSDVQQQRLAVGALRTELALVALRDQAAVDVVASILGSEEVPNPSQATLPSLPPSPLLGTPASVLDQRPEVRAARSRIDAAGLRARSAFLQRLPTLRLDAAIGWGFLSVNGQRQQSVDTNNDGMPDTAINVPYQITTDGLTWQASATLNVPIWDGFRGDAQESQRALELRAAAADFDDLVTSVVSGVERASREDATYAELVGQFEEQARVAAANYEEVRERYLHGLADFTRLLIARTTHENAQRALLTGRRSQLSARVRLHRALGFSLEGMGTEER